MAFCKKIVNFIDRMNDWIGCYFVAAVVFVFVGVVFSNVIMRYVFNSSSVFMAELEWHLFAFIFLIGAGYTLLHDRHVRVDIFYSIMGPRVKAAINCVGVLLFLFPSCYLVLTTTIPWVYVAYEVREVSLDPGGIPYRFLMKAVLPLGYGFILLQGISILYKNLSVLFGKTPEQSS